MKMTGGQAPNQYSGRHPCEVVLTRPRAKAAARRYPKAYCWRHELEKIGGLEVRMELVAYTLLEDSGNDTAGFRRAVFQRGGRCVSVQTAHGNAEQRATGEELLVGVAESGSL
jgi:hypothetical protein